jgi:energy-coupling factor transporter ATP-binding protein EcfA2
MRVASMILRDFVPFKDAGIRELQVTFSEKVQIVIGTNGSGKSQSLKQLSPIPPVRSVFGKQGFKNTVYEKGGIYYRLESEFEKPSSPHLFFEGDSEENLNQGRTTETQRELIAEHLGITPLINDLMMNNFVFPKMTASKRKEILMQMNPDDIGFVLPLHRQTASKVKACRANLARLTERKIMLEQQLIDDESMEALLTEKDQIGQELSGFQQILMNLEVGTRTLGPVGEVTLAHLPEIKQTVRRCRNTLMTLSHVTRDDHKRQIKRENILSAIAVCTQQITEKDEEIGRLSADLQEKETRYREIAVDGDLKIADLTIDRLEAEVERLQVSRPPFELSQQDLDQRYEDLDRIREQLLMFANLTVPLLPAKRRQHRERLLQNLQYRQSSLGMRQSELETQYEDLSRRHKLSPSDIPDAPCAKNACPLYSHFMSRFETTEAERVQVGHAIARGQRRIARVNQLVGMLATYFEQSRPYTDRIQWLVNQAQGNPVLHHVLRQIDILSVLASSPNRITRLLQEAYDHIGQWLKLKTVLADLETAHALKTRQISSEDHDTIKLVSAIESTKMSLYELREGIEELSKRRVTLSMDLSHLITFDEIKKTMLGIQHQYVTTMHEMANGHEKDRLSILRRGVESVRDRHFLRMSEIESALRNQSIVRGRYEEEVVSQILIIEKELRDLEIIVEALTIIPKENMIGFINDIFVQANSLIDKIWTVPLKIEPLSMDDTLDYTFKVTGDNQSERELSECSEGQTEILSLAINLAIRIVLQHFDYPLMLDETGRTFDEKHRQNLITLLKRLMDDKVISQLFLVSHHAAIHEAFTDSETMVIREDNIVLPPGGYNQHATFK